METNENAKYYYNIKINRDFIVGKKVRKSLEK